FVTLWMKQITPRSTQRCRSRSLTVIHLNRRNDDSCQTWPKLSKFGCNLLRNQPQKSCTKPRLKVYSQNWSRIAECGWFFLCENDLSRTTTDDACWIQKLECSIAPIRLYPDFRYGDRKLCRGYGKKINLVWQEIAKDLFGSLI